ncbi:MAG: GDCCVxC domain-containing (seleno)protein [Patescibacteria group bacterium]
MSIIKTKAILTCPICNAKQDVEMPINACQHFYKCTNCNKMLKPKKGDCCVFCSYADSKCPPQTARGSNVIWNINFICILKPKSSNSVYVRQHIRQAQCRQHYKNKTY